MKKIFLTLLVLLAASSAFADALNIPDVIPHNISELPFYGNVQKTPQMQQADEQFKKTAIEKAGSADKASDYFAGQAWTAFQNAKLNDAIKRANESLLLDDRNYRAYWVMAIVQKFRGAPHDEVDALFKKAIANVSAADKARFTQDYQTFLSGNDENAVDNLQQVSQEYQKAKKALVGGK